MHQYEQATSNKQQATSNKHKLSHTLILAGVLVCGICIGASAAGNSQQITATIEPELTVTFDGIDQDFFDANGQRVYPILYNGSTYLPMRAVCEQLAGFDVSWDQATRTASIISVPADGVDLIDEFNVYDMTSTQDQFGSHVKSDNKQSTEISGITTTHWVQLYFKSWSSNGMSKRLLDTSAHASFNVMGQYDTLTFKYYAPFDGTLQVIGDNDSVLWEKEVSGGQVAQETTVNLIGTSQLTFQFTNRTEHEMAVYIFDARRKEGNKPKERAAKAARFFFISSPRRTFLRPRPRLWPRRGPRGGQRPGG